MCGTINKCRDDPCSTDQGGGRRGFAGQIKDRECGVVCGDSYALQHNEDFRDFLNKIKIKRVETLLVCRCDRSNPEYCSAGDDQVPCCDCPLSNWPDLCMVIKAFKGCVAVAISCKCHLTSKRHKEFVNVLSIISEDLLKWKNLSSYFKYLLILVPKEYLKNFKKVAEQHSNIEVMRCYT